MYADERRHVRIHLALVKDDEFLVAVERTVPRDAKITRHGGQVRRRDPFDRYRSVRPRAIVICISQVQNSHEINQPVRIISLVGLIQ